MGEGPSSPIQIGIVGLGAVAQAVHLPLLHKHPERFRIAALCDLSRATRDGVGRHYGVEEERRFARADQLLDAGGLDAVAILTSGSHAGLAGAAAGTGLAVFCEKPLAYSVGEIDELAAVEPVLQLGYMKLYDPAVERAAAVLSTRPAPRSVEVTVLHPPSGPQLAHAGLLPPAGDVGAEDLARLAADEAASLERALGPAPRWLGELYAEVFLGSVVHDLAVIRALVGGGLEIDDADVWPAEAADGSVALEGRLPDGARVSIRWHYLEGYPAYREEVRVHDEQGSVELAFPAPYLLHAPTVLTVVGADDEAERVTTTRSTVEAFEQQWLAFESLVRDGTPPRAAVDEGREDVLVCQSATRVVAARHDVEIGGEATAAISELAS
ncbi:MAG TPA: Gfo/Idh/MocA family oxidoreductase [Gaiellaceae bacterium]|nr:Gfo/Idh/MocA family oxidoreductase [Gaiellaceae bacterium]